VKQGCTRRAIAGARSAGQNRVVAGCCTGRGCDEFFDRRFAQRLARRYRRRGLDRTARRIVGFLEERGVEGATVLEIGGGIGDIQIELLERGAARSTNLELSPAYDDEAQELLREAGLEGRADRVIHDIASDPGGVEPGDVVVLNRVVCCYPDYELLLAAAAEHARRLLVFSYPPRNVLSRLVVTVQNLLSAARRREFRVYTHPPSAMLAVLERHGLRPAYAHRSGVWRIAGLERA
jgi:magnesium-protoporphyrin O-methyltransferase